MAKQRNPHEEEREERKHEDREGRHHAPHGTGYGTERSAYLDYLARKWQGSGPPTPQAYARAIRLWRQLPGAVMTAPTDLGTLPESGGSGGGGGSLPKNELPGRHSS